MRQGHVKTAEVEVDQHGIHDYFGRPVEEALCELMRQNKTTCKIGCALRDANSLDVVNRAIMRNCDLERRRKKGGGSAADNVAAKEKPILKGITLDKAPEDKQAFEVFGNPDQGKQDNLTAARNALQSLVRSPPARSSKHTSKQKARV